MAEFFQSNWLWILLGGGFLFFLLTRLKGRSGYLPETGEDTEVMENKGDNSMPVRRHRTRRKNNHRGGCCG